MRALLFGVDTTDWVTYGAGTVALAAVVLATSYLASRRATGIDPMIALRAE